MTFIHYSARRTHSHTKVAWPKTTAWGSRRGKGPPRPPLTCHALRIRFQHQKSSFLSVRGHLDGCCINHDEKFSLASSYIDIHININIITTWIIITINYVLHLFHIDIKINISIKVFYEKLSLASMPRFFLASAAVSPLEFACNDDMQIMMMIDDEEEDDDEDEDEDHDDGEEEDQVYKRMTHSGVWLNVKSSCP